VADFDGGLVSSDAGALLLGETDKAIGLIDRLTACFGELRRPEVIGLRCEGSSGLDALDDGRSAHRTPPMGARRRPTAA
jgi:hypothetical protein